MQPPTKEEIVRTIFIGGITEGIGSDEEIERILRAAGKLRRWIRATDADDKACKFGFAEYEDPESLGTAVEVLRDVEVPVKRQTPPREVAKEKEEVEKSKLLVCLKIVFMSPVVLRSTRLSLMTEPCNISNNSKLAMSKIQLQFSRDLMLHEAHSPVFCLISLTPRFLSKRKILPRSIRMGT
jgi:hypothetical protein